MGAFFNASKSSWVQRGDSSHFLGFFKKGKRSSAFWIMCGFSHSSLTLADAECSSTSESQAPVSILSAPWLAAVNGPTSVWVSELYMKRTAPRFICCISSLFVSVHV